MEGTAVTTSCNRPLLGISSSTRSRAFNAGAPTEYWKPESGTFVVCLVDGTCNTAASAQVMWWLPKAALRVAARDSALAGVLTAAYRLRGSPIWESGLLLVVVAPGEPVVVTHSRNWRAYSCEHDGLHQQTEDHTTHDRMTQKRTSDKDVALNHRPSGTPIGRSTVVTGRPVTSIYARRIVLTTDGVHTTLTPGQMTEIVENMHHTDDPQACADALVGAAREAGSRDEATAVVVFCPGTTTVSRPGSDVSQGSQRPLHNQAGEPEVIGVERGPEY